jgi:hypothetical protein
MMRTLLPVELRVPGAIVDRDGQTYQLERIEPYQRRNGTMTSLAVWSSASQMVDRRWSFAAPGERAGNAQMQGPYHPADASKIAGSTLFGLPGHCRKTSRW